MFGYHLRLDNRRIRLSDQYYGFIFQKNHSLDTFETLEVSCVIDTINKAKARRNIDQPLIIHSDRGSQYVAKEYKKATENMQRSYSKKAFPWDNACIESFHSIIKREWLNHFKIRDYKQAYRLIFEYLEAFYNTKRIHSHCDFMSPDEFERVYERTHTKAELLAS